VTMYDSEELLRRTDSRYADKERVDDDLENYVSIAISARRSGR
jgi:hypothetical protein